MTDSFIQLPADSTGKKVDTEQLTVSAQTVQRERMQVAGATDVAIAVVDNNAPAGTEYGLHVRHVGDVNIADGGNVISVDDAGGSLTVDGSVSITGALPAGTNNIGDVDVITLPGTYAEDAAHASGNTGMFVLGVRNDGASALTSLDGDYSPLATDSAGRVGIADLGGSITVDGSVSITGSLPAGTNNIGDVDVLSLPALPAGTNNIGDVDVLTLPSIPAGTNNIGDVDVASIAAGATKIGSVNRELEPAISGTVTAVKFAEIDAAASGDNTIVTAVAGKKIRVLSYTLVASGGANTCEWKNGAATPVSGGMGFAANGGASAECSHGLFETSVNTNLVLNLSAATSVDGHLTYIEV